MNLLFICIIYISQKYFVNSNTIKTSNEDLRSFSEIDKLNTFYNRTDLINGQEVVFRVINGRPAKVGQFPYQVAFMKAQSSNHYIAFCGGAIIGHDKILTAAHCFYSPKMSDCFKGSWFSKDFNQKVAVAGTVRSFAYKGSRDGQWRYLLKGTYPPKFKFPDNDVAVVHTNKPFYFNPNVSKISFATKFTEYSGFCLIAGYGRINNDVQSPILLWAPLEVLPRALCNFIHNKDMSKFICTSDIVADVHKGDSGSPLVCMVANNPQRPDLQTPVVVGVVSGKSFSLRSSSFFTRISSYSSLVNKTLRNQFSICLILICLKINYILSLL